MILLAKVVGNHHRSTRMCQSIGCSKMLDSFASCRTTFLSLFIGQSLHMLLPFPGGFTNVCFSNSLTLLWRHNYRIEISFVAQEICKRMFDLLSATNRKWLVWQEVACSGMSVSSHLQTTHAQQHRWLYNEVTLWNPTNEKTTRSKLGSFRWNTLPAFSNHLCLHQWKFPLGHDVILKVRSYWAFW